MVSYLRGLPASLTYIYGTTLNEEIELKYLWILTNIRQIKVDPNFNFIQIYVNLSEFNL